MIDIISSITYNTSAPLTNDSTIDEYHDVNDTALVPQPVASKSIILSFGFVTLRVIADNPGAWLLHCKSKTFFIHVIFF